jgi:hypothetical protein
MGYRLFWHKPPLFSLKNYKGRKDNIFSQYYHSINMICIPEGKSSGIEGILSALQEVS